MGCEKSFLCRSRFLATAPRPTAFVRNLPSLVLSLTLNCIGLSQFLGFSLFNAIHVHAFQTYYVCFQTYYVCTRLFVMAIPRPRFSDLLCLYSSVCDGYIPRPRFSDLLCLFSDLLCLYSSVCDGCTSSTLFRLTMFVFRLAMLVLVCL